MGLKKDRHPNILTWGRNKGIELRRSLSVCPTLLIILRNRWGIVYRFLANIGYFYKRFTLSQYKYKGMMKLAQKTFLSDVWTLYLLLINMKV
ncbi:MAG TPA: hypothetical protein DEF27_02090 [Oscillatoriales bacterium UBA8482]|nr:hypothetical protein [Oscillatoriales bacterium UBA8482]